MFGLTDKQLIKALREGLEEPANAELCPELKEEALEKKLREMFPRSPRAHHRAAAEVIRVAATEDVFENFPWESLIERIKARPAEMHERQRVEIEEWRARIKKWDAAEAKKKA